MNYDEDTLMLIMVIMQFTGIVMCCVTCFIIVKTYLKNESNETTKTTDSHFDKK